MKDFIKNNKNYLIIGAIIVVIVLGIWYGVNKESNISTEKEPMKIGAMVGLTGAGAFYGVDVKDGMLLAEKELNQKGGNIRIIIEDNKTDPKESVTAFKKLKDIDKVDAMISLYSNASVPLVPLVNENKIPLMVSLTSATDIGKNPYVLQYYLKAEEYAYPIADAVSSLGYTKVGLMHVQDDFGQSVRDAFIEKFQKNGGEVVIIEPFIITQADFKTNLTKIRNSEAQAIVFGGFKPNYINTLKDIYYLGIDLPFFEMSPNTMYPEIIKELGQAAEGVIAVSLEYPIKHSEGDFEREFKKEYGRDPNVASTLGYDMVQIIARAVGNKKITGEDLIKKIIELKSFKGLNGKTEISTYGEFKLPVGLIKIQGGRITSYNQ